MRTWRTLLDVIDAGGRAALVTVVQAAGSTPREAGARMVVRADGGFHGTIGGGTLEWHVLAECQRLLGQPETAGVTVERSLGPDLGQCCGGRVAVLIETFDAADRAAVAELAGQEGQGPFATLGTRGADGRYMRRVADALPARGADARLGADRATLAERFDEAPTPLLLFGAGHVARALVLALAPLPFAVRWIDPRPDAFPRAFAPNVTPVHAPDAATEIDAAPDGALLLVMTHSHPLDLEIVHRALAAGRFPYVGLIGSATKRARFLRRLAEAGIDPAALVCPVGIPGLEGKEPAVIAASVAAQLLLERSKAAAAQGGVSRERRIS